VADKAYFHVQIKQFCKTKTHRLRTLEEGYTWYEQDQMVTGRTEIINLFFTVWGSTGSLYALNEGVYVGILTCG